MITRIAHVGIATRSLSQALEFFTETLGLECESVESVEDQQVKAGVLRVGDCHIELLEATDAASPIARFIEKKGPGIHHLTLEVDDIEAELVRLKGMGVRLIDEHPKVGAG